jgi:hypothetical protein
MPSVSNALKTEDREAKKGKMVDKRKMHGEVRGRLYSLVFLARIS